MSEFEILLSECLGSLERYVRYRISDRTDSEDVFQETAFAAFRQFDKLKNKDNFKAWLIGIARNKCADYYRSKRGDLYIDELPETVLVQSRCGLTEYTPVSETIEELSEKDRQMLRLFYYEDIPQNEIAAKLNIPLGTVKSRISTAKKNFRKLYPYPPKGEDNMFKFPEKMPDYKIISSEERPFTVKWEELMGWFIIPKLGNRLCWAMYDQPDKKRGEQVEMLVECPAEVHGIQGVQISAKEYFPNEANRIDGAELAERMFVAQLTDTHCRFLAESHVSGGVRKNYTFLDGDAFLQNWGFGDDNCGNATNIVPKGDILRNGSVITTADKPFLLDTVGRYTVEINKKTYDTVCVMDIETYSSGTASEQFIDKNGRTVLWRRFNRDDWAAERYGKPWTELLPDSETIEIDGKTYVHWYDCVTDYIF